MTSFRFVHAADLHLDTPFQGVAQPAPAVAEALRDASLAAWDELVELTLREQAAFLLLAGDIYDGAERGMRAQFRFLHGLERLADARVPVFIVHGNHDPLGEGWSGIERWPETVKVFGSDQVTAASAERDGTTLATVHGISYAQRAVSDNLAARFPSPDDHGLQVALLHCNAGGNAEHEAYSPCSVAQLLDAGYQYWALGHIHRRQSLGSGKVAIEYPGDLQGRSAKASELGEKGALVVEASGHRLQPVRFATCDRVRFAVVEADIATLGDMTHVRDALLDDLARLQTQHGGCGLLLRGRLSGRGGLHTDLRRPDALPALLDELRAACNSEAPFVWWDALSDQTRSPIDREAIARRGDLSAELLHLGAALATDQEARRGFLEAALAEGPGRQLPEESRAPDDAEAVALLAEAEDLALDGLEGD